nr:RNA-directed DNA polymerase, eukaryota, reverse transcriptase zinc-binding domain protein [Tanacetum cinerariifolium]
MESLHLSFQRVVDAGMFTGIKLSNSLNLSYLFYADDVMFVGQWCDGNIDVLVHVLECFYRASGLRINMRKSKIMGIHVEDVKVKHAASKLGCLILNTPFLYLGTKVGGSMSRVQEWKEVVDKVLSRLSKWKMKALSIGRRLTLLKSVLGSMPIFHMSIFRVPSSVLHTLESIRSHFFNGHDLKSKKAGLMIKWVWRFYSQKSSLWVRVVKAIHGDDGKVGKDIKAGVRSCWLNIIKEVKTLKDQGVNVFQFMHLKLGNGDSTLFWKDNWINGLVLKDMYPRIYALEKSIMVKVSSKLMESSLDYSFHRNVRGGVEQSQYDALSDLVNGITFVPASDRYVWSLESLGEFSMASIRKVIDDNRLPKLDTLPTRLNISRRGMDIESITCPICVCAVESSSHLFLKCRLVRQINRKISLWWDVTYIDIKSYEEWLNWMVSLRFSAKLKALFEGVFYVSWWCIWSYRNKLLFETKVPSNAMLFDDVVSSSYHWNDVVEGRIGIGRDSIIKNHSNNKVIRRATRANMSSIGNQAEDVRMMLDDMLLLKSDIPSRWVKQIPIKVNVLAWKISMDRLPTRDIRIMIVSSWYLLCRPLLVDIRRCSSVIVKEISVDGLKGASLSTLYTNVIFSLSS